MQEREKDRESGKNTPIHKNQKPLNGSNVVCFFYGGCAFYLYKNTCKKVWCAKKRGCPSRTKVTNVVKTRWSIKRKTKTVGKCWYAKSGKRFSLIRNVSALVNKLNIEQKEHFGAVTSKNLLVQKYVYTTRFKVQVKLLSNCNMCTWLVLDTHIVIVKTTSVQVQWWLVAVTSLNIIYRFSKSKTIATDTRRKGAIKKRDSLVR